MDPELSQIFISMLENIKEELPHFTEVRSLVSETILDIHASRFHKMEERKKQTSFWRSRAYDTKAFHMRTMALLDGVMGLILKSIPPAPSKNHKHVPDWEQANIDRARGVTVLTCKLCGKAGEVTVEESGIQWM